MNNNKIVAICATAQTKRGIDPMAGLDKDAHRVITKRAMSSLYNNVPVYRMLEIRGLCEANRIGGRVLDVTGGMSPVIKKFLDKDFVQDLKVAMLDSDGKVTGYRNITVGETNPSGKTYYYAKQVLLVKFLMEERDEDDRALSQYIYDKLTSEGVTFVNGTAFLGKEDPNGDPYVGEHFDVLVATPSNERNKQLLMTSCEANIAWERLEEVGGYAISKKMSKGLKLGEFNKLAKRLGIFATPAIPFATVGNDEFGMLLINKKILGTEDFKGKAKKALETIGVDIDDNQFDGACWFSNNFMLKGLNNLGIKGITARQAGMFAPQNRASVLYSKCLADVVGLQILNRIAKVLMELFPNDFKIIGNAENLGLIVDTNGAKLLDLDFNYNVDGVMVYLLDLAKGTQSKTDNQLIYKLMSMDDNATKKALEKIAYEDMNRFNNGYADKTNSILDNKVEVNKFLVNLAKNNADTSFAQQVFSDKYIVADMCKEGVKKHESAYRKGQVEISSLFQRALFECSQLIAPSITHVLSVDNRGAIECFSNDILEEKREEIKAIEETLTGETRKSALDKLLTGFGVKHPAPGREELQLFRFLTVEEIKERIAGLLKAGKIDSVEKDLLFQYFYFTSYGVIKIAPSNIIKHKLAGMDTDFDGIKIVFRRELVEIVERFYASKSDQLEALTGKRYGYGGVVPFIDPSKSAKQLLTREKVIAANNNNAVVNWAEIFK